MSEPSVNAWPAVDVLAVADQQAGRRGDLGALFLALLIGNDDLVFLLVHGNAAAVLGDDRGLVLVRQHLAGLDHGLVLGNILPVFKHVVLVVHHLGVLDLDLAQVGVLVGLQDAHRAADLCNNGFALRLLAGLEELFHARQTGRDVGRAGGHTAGMERPQRELGAWLADGLGGHDAHGRAQVDHVAAAEIEAVAFGADAVLQFAGQGRAHLDLARRRRRRSGAPGRDRSRRRARRSPRRSLDR